jgi:cobalt-zinc-cadmium efflux system membrane fusion protein
VSSDPHPAHRWAGALPARMQALIIAVLLLASGAGIWISKSHPNVHPASGDGAVSSQSRRPLDLFYPTAVQWATLTVEPVRQRVFRTELVTEGKIAVDEDRSTPIYSPYAGRVTKLFVRPGDIVAVGQPLFTVQAADMVQAQNDFISAATALNKARSVQHLAEIIDKRQRLLYEGKAVPLKEVQNARAALEAAENDVRSAEVALEAGRNRLRILGKTDQEINQFQETGTIDAATIIPAPIAGTIVQRKVGPGQYVGTGATDPVFVIVDLSTVWVVAYVRETDAPAVQVGQEIDFSVLAYPNRSFSGTLSYVSAALDSSSRRLLARATFDNSAGLLKPEMFASVKILSGGRDDAVAVPRDAIIYEGDSARVWAVREEGKAIELRRIKIGQSNGNLIEVVEGLSPTDRIVTKGSLFIDRVAAGT